MDSDVCVLRIAEYEGRLAETLVSIGLSLFAEVGAEGNLATGQNLEIPFPTLPALNFYFHTVTAAIKGDRRRSLPHKFPVDVDFGTPRSQMK